MAAVNTLIAPNSVGTAQVVDHSLLKQDFRAGQLPSGRAGKPGLAGPAGVAGTAGPAGPAGPAGAAGSALAFAHINSDGTLDGPNSSNVAIVAHPNAGAFCLDVTTSQAPKNVTATLDIAAVGSNTDQIRATLVPGIVAFNCAGVPSSDILVGTTTAAANIVDRGFYITVN